MCVCVWGHNRDNHTQRNTKRKEEEEEARQRKNERTRDKLIKVYNKKIDSEEARERKRARGCWEGKGLQVDYRFSSPFVSQYYGKSRRMRKAQGKRRQSRKLYLEFNKISFKLFKYLYILLNNK